MATYRTLAMIPTSATLPGEGSPTTASEAEVVRALNMVSHFRDDMLGYSEGGCIIDLAIRVLADSLPASVYTTLSGADIIVPKLVADHLGLFGEYDAFVILNPSTLTTATTFRGVGGTADSTPWCWVKVGSDERAILCHEWGHAMTALLDTVYGEYTNFPSCPPDPPMHCNAEYGFASDLDPGWLTGFLSATLPDGKGINSTGWAIQTPSERGAKVPARYREYPSPWGLLGPLTITE